MSCVTGIPPTLVQLGIGTIVSDSTISVKYMSGGRIGSVEESFISRMKPGDHFLFGGRILEFVRVHEMTAFVKRATSNRGAIARWGDRVAIGLDVRGTTLAARGWTREGGDLYETLARLDSEGCARYVVTDVNKDGMLQGPNLQLLRDVCAATPAPVIASGGVTTIEDVRALMDLVPIGVEGAIAGTALYEGTFSLEEALALTRGTS